MHQYTNNELVFLGKQVASGKYIAKTTAILALVLSLCIGVAVGRYLVPAGGGASEVVERPLDMNAGNFGNAGTDKQLEQSIAQHEEEVKKDPMNAESWVHLGNLYFDTQQAQKAVDAYEKSLALKPNNVSVIVDCGVMYRELKKFDKSLEYFTKAISIEPRHETAHFNGGIVLYFDLGRKADAKKMWEQLVAINPNAKTPSGSLVSEMLKELDF